ncbi:class I SAM-dependent methyltransferase [Sorangium atrum]|uniref:Methyltransferase domain-containing protein n=1 Tax=Sorangium atrum TaxID=2995308 RepID=A0ABT5BWI8_9BACT|nr:methyltransferase domain-containing protein [Sorangium aterium]MDC0678525.1 methyltransferase domain-containing protein [Sorangium aterium]
MKQATPTAHDALIQEQFTRQARPFAEVQAHSAESAMGLLLDALAPAPGDAALDVACGPGIVACALAQRVASVRGLDIVPAMLDEARKRQASLGLSNVTWELGDASRLPYPDESYRLVTTRYSFHHLLEPLVTLREMARVCQRSGRVAVIDVAPAADKQAAYDAAEKIRDPSHASALTERELRALFDAAGLEIETTTRYRLEVELEAALRASFPEPGGADRLRALYRADVGVDALGVGAELRGDEVHFAYPIVILVGRKRG